MTPQRRPTRKDRRHPLWICWRGPWPLLWASEAELRWRIRTRQTSELRHLADHAARLVIAARRQLADRNGRFWRGGSNIIE